MSKTSHCVIYPVNDVHNKKSAILFKEKFILAPCIILKDVINNNGYGSKIKDKLKNFQIVNINDDKSHVDIKSQTFSVIHRLKGNKFDLAKSIAKINYIFNCPNITSALKYTLNGFQPIVLNNEAFVFDEDYVFTSSFVLLQIINGDNDRNENNSTLDLIESIVNEANTSNEFELLDMYGIAIQSPNVEKLNRVYSETTPFGNESFFETVNVGTISNILQPNNCLLVASMPLVEGCEGGAIYRNTGELIGVVICTTFSWRNENANLTLIANFSKIVQSFLSQMKFKIFNKIQANANNKHLSNSIQNSVVLIGNNSSWGTGCLTRINNYKCVLTCAHVVRNCDDALCTWKKGKFTSKIIFYNSKFNEPYDIALLSVPESIPNEFFSTCYEEKPKVGQTIYAAGFPHFSSLATAPFSPSIFDGRITKISAGMFLTDASVQAGQSGGPIYTECAKLIGISVSNSKDQRHIYPNLNMAIPIYDVLPIFEKFIKNKDILVLKQLEANRDIQSVWALEPPRFKSKL